MIAPLRDVPDSLQTATRILVGMGRHFGDEDSKIRTDVKAAFREALATAEKATILVNLDGEPTEMVDAAGVFKYVIKEYGLNRSDQWATERWFEVMERAMEAELASPSN